MIRRLKELKLWEWSPVTFPANQLAGVSDVKSALGRVVYSDETTTTRSRRCSR
jgi:phage head maturation protease